ncbi:MAG: iron chelate uptake ABC transporter family permease subunit [Myxococcota bacterium]
MDVAWMAAPVAACLIVAIALGWFGLHVLEREVLFVDLALAQVAALGTTWAVFLGHEPDEPTAYALGLLFTALGAVGFSLARRFEARVPQEAIIGIAYAVSAGGASALLDFADDPHGAEKLQHLMVGNVVWATWWEIGVLAAISGGVLLLHAVVAPTLLKISFDPEGAERAGLRLALWDMAFYLSFGVVITTVVHIAGVLLIFSYLIVPAVIARLFFDGVGRRLAAAYAVSLPVSVLGVGVSYEHAAGPIIVVLLAACLAVALIVWTVQTSPHRARTGGAILGGVGALVLLLGGLSAAEIGQHGAEGHHDHEHRADKPAATADATADADATPTDPAAREAWYRGHADDSAMLEAAARTEADPSLQLLIGAALVRAGDPDGLRVLAALAAGDTPFLRMEADDRLRKVAGDGAPAYDPLAGPDSGAWAAWAAAPPDGWAARAQAVELP